MVGSARPTEVQISAAVLIAIPLMDLLSAQRTGEFMYSYFSWILICGAGISLMIRHKSAWVAGAILCAGFVLTNVDEIIFQVSEGADLSLAAIKGVNCLLVVGIISTVIYFFRYPYLDRRQNWFSPTGDRFKIEMPVIVNGDQNFKTVDLSYTGARIAVDAAASYEVGQVISVQLTEVSDVVCQAKVVAVHNGAIRVNFEESSAKEKELVRQWLLSQNLPKT